MGKQHTYKGVEVTAETEMYGVRYIPLVKLRKKNGAISAMLHPPCGHGLSSRAEAERVAMRYGFDAVDGNVKNFDPARLD